jgi:hypothetical protein
LTCGIGWSWNKELETWLSKIMKKMTVDVAVYVNRPEKVCLCVLLYLWKKWKTSTRAKETKFETFLGMKKKNERMKIRSCYVKCGCFCRCAYILLKLYVKVC